ncbi:MAG TPA: flagellar hook-length control protein FliK, partial [Methylibium sp.]|nr:flagellar hook-length control protein FliK [Methylibium sp.]
PEGNAAARPATPARKAERGEPRPRATDAPPPRRADAAADAASAVATTLPGDGEQATTDSLDGIRAQAVIDWFARLQAPEPVAPTAIPAALQGDAAAAAPTLPGTPDATLSTTPAEVSARAALDTATLQAETPATAGAPIAAGLEPTLGEASFADVAAQAVPTEAAAARFEPGSPTPLTPPVPTALSGASAAPRAGATATLALATPVTAPDFSQALATQLTTLARDGVQHATLQLNPAEMGPIAVKIVLDGAQAQIDFAAEHARTREAIEAGLPTLAAALHGAGLTLAGGGVFEQRRGQGDASDAIPGRTAGDGESAGEPVAGVTPQRHVVRGLVDTYA